jgi:hypothetical protein
MFREVNATNTPSVVDGIDPMKNTVRHVPALPVGARHPDGHVTCGQRRKGVDEECHPLDALVCVDIVSTASTGSLLRLVTVALIELNVPEVLIHPKVLPARFPLQKQPIRANGENQRREDHRRTKDSLVRLAALFSTVLSSVSMMDCDVCLFLSSKEHDK